MEVVVVLVVTSSTALVWSASPPGRVPIDVLASFSADSAAVFFSAISSVISVIFLVLCLTTLASSSISASASVSVSISSCCLLSFSLFSSFLISYNITQILIIELLVHIR